MSFAPFEVTRTVTEKKRNGMLAVVIQSDTIQNTPYRTLNVGWMNSTCDGWTVVHADIIAAPYMYTDDKRMLGRRSKRAHGR